MFISKGCDIPWMFFIPFSNLVQYYPLQDLICQPHCVHRQICKLGGLLVWKSLFIRILHMLGKWMVHMSYQVVFQTKVKFNDKHLMFWLNDLDVVIYFVCFLVIFEAFIGYSCFPWKNPLHNFKHHDDFDSIWMQSL